MFQKKAVIVAVVSFMICVIVGIGIFALRQDKIIQTDTATEELARIEGTKTEEELQHEPESTIQEIFTEEAQEVEEITDVKDVQEDMETSSEDTQVEEPLKSKSNQMEEESDSQQTHIDDSDIATSDKIPQPTISDDTQAKPEESSQFDNKENSQNESKGESSDISQSESKEDSAEENESTGDREDDNNNPEEGQPEATKTGGKLSISYSDKLLLDKSVKTAYLNVQNPSRSDCNIIVKLQMQSDELIKMAGSTNGAVMMADSTYMTIAESAILNPGTKLESLQLTLQGEVQSGTYCAVYFVEVYDRNTGEQKAINALLPIELTVE